MPKERTLILDQRQVIQKITRMAHEIYENHHKSKDLFLIGISGNGNELAKRIVHILSEVTDIRVKHLEVTLDKNKPEMENIQFSGNISEVKGRSVILVDDVINSGRTLMYAAAFLLEADLKKLTVVTLIERFHSRFPIRANVVGLTLSTNLKEHVAVDLTPGKESVHLEA